MYRVRFGYSTAFDFKSWKEASGFIQDALDNSADDDFTVNITKTKSKDNAEVKNESVSDK